MSKKLNWKDVEIGVKCTCPWCEDSVVAIVTDYFSYDSYQWGFKTTCVDLMAKCPKCDSHFDVEMDE